MANTYEYPIHRQIVEGNIARDLTIDQPIANPSHEGPSPQEWASPGATRFAPDYVSFNEALPQSYASWTNHRQLRFRSTLAKGGYGVVMLFDFYAADGTTHPLVIKFALRESLSTERYWYQRFANLKHTTKELPYQWIVRRSLGWPSDNLASLMAPDWHRIVLMPFYPRGSLHNAICRFNSQLQGRDRHIFPTARMYWQVFKSLVHALIGLRYPQYQDIDQDEIIPPGEKEDAYAEDIIHGDLDPYNIMLDEIKLRDRHAGDGPEINTREGHHQVFGKVMIHDFGHTVDYAQPECRTYEARVRYIDEKNKILYRAPEQWDAGWLDILRPSLQEAPLDRSRPIEEDGRWMSEPAGNYSYQMNTFGIGLAMAAFMTGMFPPHAAYQQLHTVPLVLGPYAGLILDGELSTYLTCGGWILDSIPGHRTVRVHPNETAEGRASLKRLVLVIAQCLAHSPVHRPDLRDMLEECRQQTLDGPVGEHEMQMAKEVDDFLRGYYPTSQEARDHAPDSPLPPPSTNYQANNGSAHANTSDSAMFLGRNNNNRPTAPDLVLQRQLRAFFLGLEQEESLRRTRTDHQHVR